MWPHINLLLPTIAGTTFKLDIAPLQVDLTNKFSMTKVYNNWMKQFDRLITAYDNRSSADKSNILLIVISIGQNAAAY